jgi:hypothetical protein
MYLISYLYVVRDKEKYGMAVVSSPVNFAIDNPAYVLINAFPITEDQANEFRRKQ